MQIQINTDNNLPASKALAEKTERQLRLALARFAERITRLEVHLSDVNSGKGGENDKRCLIEARPAGRQPVSVSAQAPLIALAISGASDKLTQALDTLFGKLESGRRGGVRPDDPDTGGDDDA